MCSKHTFKTVAWAGQAWRSSPSGGVHRACREEECGTGAEWGRQCINGRVGTELSWKGLGFKKKLWSRGGWAPARYEMAEGGGGWAGSRSARSALSGGCAKFSGGPGRTQRTAERWPSCGHSYSRKGEGVNWQQRGTGLPQLRYSPSSASRALIVLFHQRPVAARCCAAAASISSRSRCRSSACRSAHSPACLQGKKFRRQNGMQRHQGEQGS